MTSSTHNVELIVLATISLLFTAVALTVLPFTTHPASNVPALLALIVISMSVMLVSISHIN